MLKDILMGALGSATARKGQAAGAAGAILMAADPVIKAFSDGLAAGALPNIQQMGVILGQAATGYVVGFLITWFAPPNRG